MLHLPGKVSMIMNYLFLVVGGLKPNIKNFIAKLAD